MLRSDRIRFRPRARVWMLLIALAAGAACDALAGETVYMSILSSRRHAWGKNDYPVIGLFVSKDAGMTWQHRGWREYIRMFYTEAGTDGVLWSACGNGVLRSTDDGVSWRVTTGSDVTEVLRLSVDARRPARVAAATAYGPIVSTDAGETWALLTQGLPRTFTGDVRIDRITGAMLVATERGVFRRDVAGDTWQPTSLTADTRVIFQHPADHRLFYAGTENDGVWRSTDGGRSWVAVNEGLAHRTVYAIAAAPGPQGALYLGTHGGGVYRSADGGGRWQQRSAGLTTMDCHAVAVLPSDPSVVLAGTLNGGLFRSADGGASWTFIGQEDAQVWGLSVR